LIVSNIINLAAHYKKFFTSNGLNTKVYIYHTDFNSDEFPQYKYNEDFRTYYLVKYNQNPKILLLTDRLKEFILPQVKTITDFIPDVYYISAHNIEGSLVPYIISRQDPSRKNLIIGGELYDTQYSSIPNFVNHYIHRSFNVNKIYSTINGYLADITKKTEDFSNIYNNYNVYCSLMAVLGNKIRSIDGLPGIGVKTFEKLFNEGLMNHIVQENTSSPEMICEIFKDEKLEDEFINNYYCSTILNMYQDLNESDIGSVITQLIDRSDLNSLMTLNNSKFYKYPLMLDGLL
jgi:hypothetical protein